MTMHSRRGIARIEQAAGEQVRALASLRESRDPGRILSQEQRRTRLLEARRRLVQARRLLDDARASAQADARLRGLLDGHVERLTHLAAEVGQLLGPAQHDEGCDGELLR